MTTELIDHRTVVWHGDVRVPDDLPPELVPEGGITQELIEAGIAAAERMAKIARIKTLLLRAQDASDSAKAPRIHNDTRKEHSNNCAQLRDKADWLIARLHQLDPNSEYYGLSLISLRRHYRDEALQAREGRASVELGRRAVKNPDPPSRKTDPAPYIDGQMCAAGESVRSPWN